MQIVKAKIYWRKHSYLEGKKVVLCLVWEEIKLEIWKDFLAHMGRILIFDISGPKRFPKIFLKKRKGPGRG
jgi:hypothetical protein